jgi:integrase
MAARSQRSINGYLRVEDRTNGERKWVASYVTHKGPRTRRLIGPAWVRDTGKRTPHGGRIWRAGHGSCPDGYLTPQAARDALAEILERERRLAARIPATGTVTVSALLARWLTHLEVHGGKHGPLSPGTLRDYHSIAKPLTAGLGADTPICDITVRDVRALQEYLVSLPGSRGRSLGQSRRRQLMQRLRQAFDFAVRQELLTDNPARFVDLPPPPRPHADFNVLEPSRVEAVARAVAVVAEPDVPMTRGGHPHPHYVVIVERRRALYADAVRFSAYTGLRVGELRALRWRDIDFTGQAVRVSRNRPTSHPSGELDQAPKSGRGRSVPITPAAFLALERISKLGYPVGPEDFVFATEGAGPVDGARLRHALYRGLEAAGLGYLRTKPNPFRWHDLRHTFGTMAVRVFPLTDVQAYMGHSNIQTTMRYVHHQPRADAAAKLAAAFEQDLNPLGGLFDQLTT